MRSVALAVTVAACFAACATRPYRDSEPQGGVGVSDRRAIELAAIRHLIAEARPFEMNLALLSSVWLVEALRADPPTADLFEPYYTWHDNPVLVARLQIHFASGEYLGVEEFNGVHVIAIRRNGERLRRYPNPIDFGGVHYFVRDVKLHAEGRAVVTGRADLHGLGARWYRLELTRSVAGWRVKSCTLTAYS